MNNVRIICYLPDHHENHVSVTEDDVYCQDNSCYSVVDVDLDELNDWNNVELNTSRLRVIIEVPLEYCEFEAHIEGTVGENELLTVKYSGVGIISATIPGIDPSLYDVDENNEEAEMQIYKILASR